MPISTAHAGRTYPRTPPFEVSAAKIQEFARALGDGSTGYSGPDAVAPPTFAAVLAAHAWESLFGDDELGLELARTVHYDQAFDFVRPLRAGESVTAQLAITKVRVRGARAIVTIEVSIRDARDETVCTAVSTLIHTAEEVG